MSKKTIIKDTKSKPQSNDDDKDKIVVSDNKKQKGIKKK